MFAMFAHVQHSNYIINCSNVFKVINSALNAVFQFFNFYFFEMKVSKLTFLSIARSKFDIGNNSSKMYIRRYRSILGISPEDTLIVWNKIDPSSSELVHLLWALNFLTQYTVECNGAFIWGCDEKTYRKWVWYFLDKISKLQIVSNSKFFRFLSRIY